MFRLDKNVFVKQSFNESDKRLEYWLSKAPSERFAAAIYLQSIVYGFNPEHPPRMDKSLFSKRQRNNP